MRLSRIGLVVLMFAATFARVGTFAVGECKPDLPSYITISAAVADPATAGSTIFVCAGTYNEQVLIAQPLTLEGVAVGGNSAAVVMLPSGTMQTLVSNDIGTITYQIAVVNPGGPVNLKNLVVDGTGATTIGVLAGIYYEDASGSMTTVVTRNQRYQDGGTGIIAATGQVVSAAQTIAITSSVLTNFDGNGIYTVAGSPLALTIKSNTIDGNGPSTSGLRLEGDSNTGTVASNIINATQAIRLVAGNVTASSNTIWGEVNLTSGSNTITNNHIDALTAIDGQGIGLNGPGTNVVESNSIVNAGTAIFGCGNVFAPSASGDTVMHNTMLNSGLGIDMPSGNTVVSNYFELVPTTAESCQ